MNTRGNTLLNKYRSGKKLKFKDSIIAKCADCMNYYADGRYSCSIPGCPLFPFMPYKKKHPHDIATDEMHAKNAK